MNEPTADATWRRFTLIVAVLTGMALIVGMALSYSSAYSAAYDAGFDQPWIYGHGWELRPAHLFPLTLDLPVFAAYLGIIALAGRRSVSWARGILVSCAFATVSLQVIDGVGLIEDHASIRAVIHGWPPALAILTTHLLVKIVQALGFLVPPVAEPARTPWVVRSVRWVVATMTGVVDTWRTRKGTAEGTAGGHRTGHGVDTGQDPQGTGDRTEGGQQGDTGGDSEGTADRTSEGTSGGQDSGQEADTREDTGPDTEGDTEGDTGGDNVSGPEVDKPQVAARKTLDTRTPAQETTVVAFTGQRARVVAAVIAGRMTQKDAAAKLGCSTKTISRYVAAAGRAAPAEATG